MFSVKYRCPRVKTVYVSLLSIGHNYTVAICSIKKIGDLAYMCDGHVALAVLLSSALQSRKAITAYL